MIDLYELVARERAVRAEDLPFEERIALCEKALGFIEPTFEIVPGTGRDERDPIELVAYDPEWPARFEAWNAWPIAGGPQDDVGLDLAPVHEPYRAPSKLRDVGLGDDVAVREIVQQLRVDDRMSRERLVVRLRKTVTA